MKDTMKDTFSAFGDRAIEVVDKVGRKRALIGLAILAAVTAGAIITVKLIRNRAARVEAEDETPAATGSRGGKRGRRGKGNNLAGASASAQ